MRTQCTNALHDMSADEYKAMIGGGAQRRKSRNRFDATIRKGPRQRIDHHPLLVGGALVVYLRLRPVLR
jgi:hypothetical protein